ncbi:hypothetical protein DOM22_08270 [Bdellovibrio sp. ZAP7]|nr:hypothetical protein DOM22_08270 [Bdellovibrio sp. ZAP7]
MPEDTARALAAAYPERSDLRRRTMREPAKPATVSHGWRVAEFGVCSGQSPSGVLEALLAELTCLALPDMMQWDYD